jgi:hypothetical protein
MKIRLQLILTFAAMALMGSVAYGQDAHFSDFDVTDPERDRLEKEKILYSPGGEGEIRYVPARIDPAKTTASKDSVNVNTQKPVVTPQVVPPTPAKVKSEGGPKSPAKQQPPKEDDDAILSFNFLYYIIQKYKLQDIIE